MDKAAIPISQRMNGTEWGMLLTLSLLWGCSFLFIGLAARELPPFTIVAARVAIATSVLLLIIRFTGERLPTGRVGDFLVLGLISHAIPFTLIAWGQHHIPSGMAAILNATTPLFTMLVLRFALPGQVLGASRLAGLAFGIGGVALLMGPKALAGAGSTVAGGAAILLAAFSYGLSGYWVRRFADLAPRVTAAGAMLATTAITLPVALVVERPWQFSPSAGAFSATVALGAVSTAAAYLVYYPLVKRAGAINASLVTFLVPVNAILLGALVLHERLDWHSFAGMGLIFAGLAGIDGRPLRWLRMRLV